MSQKLSVFALFFANLLIPVAIFVFATGFFPYKTFVPGRASFDTDREHATAPFDKVVFMVVDALRRFIALPQQGMRTDFHSDFVYAHGSGFRFTQRYDTCSLLRFPIAENVEQPYTVRRRGAFYRSRKLSYDNHAADQSYNHRINSLLSRRYLELCRVGHHFKPGQSGQLAHTIERKTRGKVNHVWRRHLVEAVS